MSNHYINYNEFIKSYTWKAIQKTKLGEQWNCECCWDLATNVHHLSYERLWKERADDIVSICENCHNKCHYSWEYEIKNKEEMLRKRFNEVRNENWYNWTNPKIEEIRRDDIENSDSQTLTKLNERFSKDKNHIYEYGKIIKNFDVATFNIVRNNYLKDKNGIYDHRGNFIKSDDWLFLEEISWNLCRDINNVYYSHIWEWSSINWVDSWSFKEVESPYFKDKNGLFKESNGKIIKYTVFKLEYDNLGELSNTSIYSPDLSSFEVINDDYTKDKNYIFFDRIVLEWVDPSSFLLP